MLKVSEALDVARDYEKGAQDVLDSQANDELLKIPQVRFCCYGMRESVLSKGTIGAGNKCLYTEGGDGETYFIRMYNINGIRTEEIQFCPFCGKELKPDADKL